MIHKFNSVEDLAREIELHYDIEPSPDWGGASVSRWELDHNTITLDMTEIVNLKDPIDTFMVILCDRESRYGNDLVEVHAKLTSWVKLDGKFLATYDLTIV